MKTLVAFLVAFVATFLLPIVFALILGWLRKRMKQDAPTAMTTMEHSMNNGCQTSLLLIVFGTVSAAIVWAVILLVGY